MFRCRKVIRVKDERGRREWARENGMRWDSWDALASKKWVRMEEGQADPSKSGFAMSFLFNPIPSHPYFPTGTPGETVKS